MKITIELTNGWWDWTVEGDSNARAPYCGTADTFFGAYEGIARTIQGKKRHPRNPKVRTEY